MGVEYSKYDRKQNMSKHNKISNHKNWPNGAPHITEHPSGFEPEVLTRTLPSDDELNQYVMGLRSQETGYGMGAETSTSTHESGFGTKIIQGVHNAGHAVAGLLRQHRNEL